ncbi:MAG TPA: PilT/PilU family type 4a pilus ATPase [Kofleriaceae bacterium]|nr:PilT/PilU family type 4a pilus ATPase [Kofleriaceae bacterium]
MSMPDSEWDPIRRGLLEHMLSVEASDLYIAAHSPTVFRINGVGYPAKKPFEPEMIAQMADTLMTPAQREEFRAKLEMNLALATSKGGRFRASIFRQRGATGMVVRLVRTQIKTLEELQHPPILSELMKSKRGLILVVGGTGSGKSTTLAAMIDHRNRSDTGHILTVEDPVEFIHAHQKCVVTQREVGIDTRSYHDALKSALRQAPDLILIGEIRDAETMEAAITFAETGHLCLATLHSNNANQTIERVLNFFPPERANEIRLQLSLNLRAIISQRLVKSQDGGRAAALEILLDTPRIRELIKRGEVEAIKDAMEQGTGEGCKTFDSALYDLVVEGRISDADALAAADSPNNLRIRLDRFRNTGRAVELPNLRLVKRSAT